MGDKLHAHLIKTRKMFRRLLTKIMANIHHAVSENFNLGQIKFHTLTRDYTKVKCHEVCPTIIISFFHHEVISLWIRVDIHYQSVTPVDYIFPFVS